MKRGILGSASPARAKLMSSLGLSFDIVPSNLQEKELPFKGDIFGRALEIAEAKMASLRKKVSCKVPYIICADTCVIFAGKSLGKPTSLEEAKEWLMAYSGQAVQVCTGLVLFSNLSQENISSKLVTTTLQFAHYTKKEIGFYLALNPPWQVAGGFAWQQGAEMLVEEIRGSSSNIIGLPIFEFCVMLKEHRLF